MVSSRLKKQSTPKTPNTRLSLTLGVIYLLFIAITTRLFYWQIVKGDFLQVEANKQYQQYVVSTGRRGSIYTSDNHLLVGNQKVYRLFAEPHLFSESTDKMFNQLFPILLEQNEDFQEATEDATLATIEANFENYLKGKLQTSDKKWVSLVSKVDEPTKEKIQNLKITGLGFDPYYQRFYPEASMAAHLTGFVGKDKDGYPIGYFGIEGALNKELAAETEKQIKDNFSSHKKEKDNDGRDLVLTIRRNVQFVAETELQKAIEKYEAKSGEIIIMEPDTGKILALATFPKYDQNKFYKFPQELHKNPSISTIYEPGSTFKVLTVAAGLDSGAITPETECTRCSQARKIDKYTIRTWNDEYIPNINMTEALAKSDNTAMIFIEEEMGKDNFIQYIQDFGVGEKVTNDLQEDFSPPFPEKWDVVELATRSFGQGVSTTSLQLVRAINSIANGGMMMQPQIIEKVINQQNGEEIETQPVELKQVVSAQTAEEVTKMMIESANHGEAQWVATDEYLVAGKTGTSQIPKEDGGYHEDKTIASFIGFAPANNPQFIMLTKLVEPKVSPWASETAAPLWYRVADKLLMIL